MTVLLYVGGVLLFLIGIGVSIGLHEMGHMIPARKFGVKVTQYFVGFGPTVWSKKVGETEYGVKAIPLGGYVKLVGMLPPSPGEDGTRVRKSNTGIFAQLISDARSAEYELVEPGDEERLFYRKAWWKKLIVMSGGPIVNLAIAFFLFLCVFGLHGVPELRPTVSSVAGCTAATCADADGESPAEVAGLRKGDKIEAVNGTSVRTWEQTVTAIQRSAGKSVSIQVVRDGSPTTLTADIEKMKGPEGTTIGYLGVRPVQVRVTHGPIYTAEQMGDYTWQTVQALGNMPAKLYGVGRTVLGLQDRDPESPVSVVGAGRIAGETASTHTITVGDRLASLAVLLAGVNLFLGMFNFVPLLPLDGGHIAGALYEAARRGLARLFKRPDPGYFDVAKLLPVAYTVAGVLLVMTVLLVYADIVDPVKFQ